MYLLRTNTYPVYKTLEEPFSAVNPTGHLLLILMRVQRVREEQNSSLEKLTLTVTNLTGSEYILQYCVCQSNLTKCFLSFGKSLERIWSWWFWKR